MIDQYPSPNGVLTSLIWRKTAAGGETSLSGYDNASQALSYTPGQEQVYLNGILLVRGDDYTATNGTSITGLAALSASDFVQVNCYNNFSVASLPSTSITGEITNSQITSLATSKLTGTIANNQLANSSITINGSAVSLGGSVTLAGDIESVSAGTGLTGGGSSGAVTLSLDTASVISPTIVNAKGDILTASANNTPAILSLGNSGETLVADSSTSTGLRWQGHIEAGKNFLINGGFDIWQRGTSSTGNAVYGTADRWLQLIESGSGTWAQETTVVPTGATYSLKFTASSTSSIFPIQAIESINATRLAGKRVVFSGLVAASTSTAMSMVVSHSSSVDVAPAGSWTNLTAVSGGTATPTSTTFVPISGVYDIPSTAKSIRVIIRTTSTIANGVVVYWGNLQLELGSVATEFSRAGGTLAGELAACQRYFQRYGDGSSVTNSPYVFPSVWRFGDGSYYGGTPGHSAFILPVVMRTTPTLSSTGTWFKWMNSNFKETGTWSIQKANEQMIHPRFEKSSGTWTGDTGFVASENGGYINLSAEL